MALGAGALQQIGSGGLSGKKKDLAAWQKLPDVDSRVDPIHIRHDHIADDQLRTFSSGPLDRVPARVDRRCIESILIQYDGQGISDHALVIDNEHLWFLAQGHCGNRPAPLQVEQGLLFVDVKRLGLALRV